MLGTLQTVLIALLTLGILVTIHEFGHFWVARRCGIRVLRFSVGFGPVLWRKTDRQQTEYTLCAIPLGGYVRMLDEREGEVAEEQLGEAFNRKSVCGEDCRRQRGSNSEFSFGPLGFLVSVFSR